MSDAEYIAGARGMVLRLAGTQYEQLAREYLRILVERAKAVQL